MPPAELAPGVWRAGTRFVNWYIVDAGADGLTLVDSGLPGYRHRIGKSLAAIGRSVEDVRAVVLTHGHIDHVGSADVLAGAGAQVHLHPADERLAADPRRNRPEKGPLPYLLWPATLAFVAHAASQGATRPRPMPDSMPLRDGEVADVPGRPLVIHTPGHTDGHCALEFRDHGVLFIGDLLCTVDPFSGRKAAPQLQTRGTNRSSDQAMASLSRLEGVRARLVLPGHGGPWRDGVEAAADSARLVGCR